MLNTRASINQALAAATSLSGIYDDYQTTRPGAATYPSIAVRILGDDHQIPAHFGKRTPDTQTGAERYNLVVECEVRTNSTTWNEALYHAGLIRMALDKKTKDRKTWLTNATTVNPAPVVSGFLRFGESRVDRIQGESEPQFKSAFLTWEVLVEVPVS